jgi:ATP-binding cassette subfamily B protein/subfamily B ATP-binding cassette protein MsbA
VRTVDRDQVRGRIDFENVSFHYPASDRPVLSEINLSVAAGTTIALVGPSGAGKTTLCNLVARFYDPTAGVVRLDGTDLRELEVESYRQLIGLVEQDVFLFDGTIGDNIRYGQRDATWDELREAARLARVDEFVDQLEKGFDTVIGERGVKLSGGQRQRIAIARAILCNPKILILDEATSNLDTESEQFIQEALAGLMTQRTCFVIAHRLSTIRNATTIVVLEDGRIRELGTHAELFARDSRYREMVIRQIGSNEHLPADSV